ncbi:hypothetical protein [Streptomyces sp. Je 1-332]
MQQRLALPTLVDMERHEVDYDGQAAVLEQAALIHCPSRRIAMSATRR